MKKTYKRILAATLASILVWNTCEWQPRALAGSKVYQIEEVKALPESVLRESQREQEAVREVARENLLQERLQQMERDMVRDLQKEKTLGGD